MRTGIVNWNIQDLPHKLKLNSLDLPMMIVRQSILLGAIHLLLLSSASDAITIEEVALHDSEDDCWSALYGTVYELTEYAPNHRRGGGPSVVYSLCGRDGTSLYDPVHGDTDYLSTISSINNLGPLVEATPEPTPATTTQPPQVSTPTEPSIDDNTPSPTTNNDTPSPTTNSPTTISPTTISPMKTTAPTTTPNDPDDGELEWITLSTLEQHNTPEDCWVVYFGIVYKMTDYAPTHPAGPELIVANCGEDGTSAFTVFHDERLLTIIQDDIVGRFDPSEQPAETEPPKEALRAISAEELASHNTPASCWVQYYEEVYDLSLYSHPSPPGQYVIYMACGQDGTKDYVSVHPRDLLKAVKDHKVGWIESSGSRRAPRLETMLLLLVGSIIFLSRH